MDLRLELTIPQVILQASLTIKDGDTTVAEGYANIAHSAKDGMLDVEEWDIDNWIDGSLTDKQVAEALTKLRRAIESAALSHIEGLAAQAMIHIKEAKKNA